MKKTILVTGLHGYIGSRFAQMADESVRIIDLNRRGEKFRSDNISEVVRADITDYKELFNTIKDKKVDVVLHLAAKTHIDNCEKDKKYGSKSETWEVNVVGTKNIVRISKEIGAYLIYLSTECVFDGKKGFYKEEDDPNPINWYGYTKFRGEQEVIKNTKKFCILRSVLAYGHPLKFPYDLCRIIWEKIGENKKFKAVNNQYLTLTFIDDLVRTIFTLIERNPYGIYHFAGKQVYTPYDLAQIIRDYLKLKEKKEISVDLVQYFGGRAKYRLENSSLSSDKIKRELDIFSSNLTDNLAILKSRIHASKPVK